MGVGGRRGVICGIGREEGGDMWEWEEGGDMWEWEEGGDMWDWEEGRVHNDIPYSLNYQMVGIG